ncbi:ABC transporter substrate-binding protein [Desulfobulbus alkaliphilus]|uniref:ABC transporter substrate-binding protein n=1 Tax=Desulfobulbus alkaliphilus TaxID=869814 RepID=UPI001962F363|nr:helical backbone metal receptor [Desulfobulbus alkaliphilus]MBM9538080.1 ABC transporter substrate-binding protein [Desulfobulbus alkaliphilus]
MTSSEPAHRCCSMSIMPSRLLLFLLTALVLSLPASLSSAAHAGAAPLYQRIVSLSPLLTENIFLLGAGDNLVGNTLYCQRPHAAQDIEKVGSVMESSIEKIISLRPDLILASNLTPLAQIAQLERLGFRVETFAQPASFAEICSQFLRLGRLLGLEKQAEMVIEQATDTVRNIQDAVAGLPRQKVFLQVGAHPLFSSVKNSFTHDFIELGGGVNIAEDQRSGAIKVEKVVALDPDVIIIAVMGSELGGVGAEQQQMWNTYSSIRATRSGRVHVVDPDLVCSPSPTTFADTLVTIATLIHPQLAQAKTEKPSALL